MTKIMESLGAIAVLVIVAFTTWSIKSPYLSERGKKLLKSALLIGSIIIITQLVYMIWFRGI